MKPTEKHKDTILKVYDTYFSGYLAGDVEKVASVFDDSFIQIGTAEREVFFNKSDAVHFLHETIDQVAGNIEFRNRDIRLEFFEELVLIYELNDVYANADGEWIFYAKCRLSTIFREQKGVWKIIHQHASCPDMRTGDGENISIEKLIAENVQLHEAVNRRTYELEQKQKDLEKSNVALQKSLEDLKATQAQLIQSEKMASLGELTAGIAHEIQNPLNFVNNFSEVSVELLEELAEEALAGNTAGILAISSDLKENLSKINHHGKRADSIVKGMLQHSRQASRQKEPTDINALLDEYLRLSYHGLRAKDKSFNASLVTDFAPDINKVAVVPQDMGRVLLNLFNNAFYAVQQKSQLAFAGEDAPPYQPQVRVSTQNLGNKIQIRIRDNGLGIPEAIKNKIFQPFFTTKPSGQGTGLGLSLSYDIITNGHGGTITVHSEEGQYAEFEILLLA